MPEENTVSPANQPQNTPTTETVPAAAPTETTPATPAPELSTKPTSSKKKLFLVAALIVVAAVAAGTGLFLWQNSQKTPEVAESTPTPEATQSPALEATAQPEGNPIDIPSFSTPEKNEKVSSPLTVGGIVPAGWMFEGNVAVKLLDEKRNVIAQAPGEEVNPGTWMDENPDEFKATLTFTTTSKTGYLVVSADNPSGLPENEKSYEIPIKF